MNQKIKEALSRASEIRGRIEVIECCEDWTGGMPDIGTCRKFGEIKRISDDARAALALCDDYPAQPSESAPESVTDTSGIVHTVIQSDRDLAEKLHEIWEDYRDDREENALRIAIYRESFTSKSPSESARELVKIIRSSWIRADGHWDTSITEEEAAALIESSLARIREECAERAQEYVESKMMTRAEFVDGLRAAILAQPKEEP